MGLSSCNTSKKLMISEAKVDKLKQDSTGLQNKLDNYNDRTQNLEANSVALQDKYFYKLDNIKPMLPRLEITNNEQSVRLKNLQEIIQLQKYRMNNLKTSILETLKFYKPDELYVYIKNGNVYVSFEENLLFKLGSDSIVSKGKEALQKLTIVLNNAEDINVMIEGHTDNSPIINSLAFKDNWELSTAKATSIVRVLTKEFGFDSNRISASGKAEFQPVSTNETIAGRVSNRRTEIILSMSNSEVFNLLYSSID